MYKIKKLLIYFYGRNEYKKYKIKQFSKSHTYILLSILIGEFGKKKYIHIAINIMLF